MTGTFRGPAEAGDLPGARESNAGDDFHILWALSRCLKLIDPASGLTAVSIEDVSPSDRAAAGSRDFLTADVTQYYGGESFDVAERIEISQLKYSHRHPGLQWTAARLAPAGVTAAKSTLGKLASAFRHLLNLHGRQAVLSKLTMQLVSNQPASRLLTETVALSRTLLSEDGGILTADAISRQLPTKRHRDELNRLFIGSGLKNGEFPGFLQVLDLEQLGIVDRFGQEERIVRTLGRHVIGSLSSELNNLYQLVHSQAMPEAAGRSGLRREDVLARLGFTEWHGLPDVETIARPRLLIEQPSAAELVRLLMATSSRKVLAHGATGVGKSTTLLQLERHLPNNSSLVIFDCFAGGAYRTPGQRRHTPQAALHMLINQIAIKCGTPFLVKNDGTEEVLWRHFRAVLDTASKSLSDTGAHLVLAIDAADNSVVAARERGERSFVHDLWKIALPENVHLLLSCRTGRRALLECPADLAEYELVGFDLHCSSTHLRGQFPDASDEICQRFHLRSHGNPRAQAYVLSPENPGRPSDAAGCADLVKPTPNDQFQSLIETATDAAPVVAETWLSIMAAMQPPVRITALAAVLDIEQGNAKEFCRALEPGVKVEGDIVSFTDEDFEAFIRERFDEARTRSAHATIAGRLQTIRHHEGWAAAALGEHLAAAGDATATINLALNDGSPTAIHDPAARTRVHLRRIALALRTNPPPRRAEACRLIALASQLNRTNDAIRRLVREHPDLALRFADPIEVARAHADDIVSADGWDGPAHFRLAVIAAENGDVGTARRTFDLGLAWLHRYFDKGDIDRHGSFTAEHAAIAAEVVYRLDGPRAAAEWLRRWSPLAFVEATASHLVGRLMAARLTDGLPSHIAEARPRPRLEAKLLAMLYSGGIIAKPTQVRRIADALIASPPALESDDWGWLADFFELAVVAPIGRRRVLTLLDTLRPRDAGYAPDARYLGPWRDVLRAACLEAAVRATTLTVAELIPRRLKDRSHDDDPKNARGLTDERERLERALNANLDDHRFHAEAIVGVAAQTLPARALEAIVALHPNARSGYRGEDWSGQFHRTAVRTLEAVLHIGAEPADIVDAVLVVAEDDGTQPVETWLSLSEVLLRYPGHVTLGLDLVGRVARHSTEREEPLYEKTDRMVRCAALARGIDDALAQECFGAAIAAAGDFSDDRAALLTLANTLATTGLATTSSLPAPHLALQLRQAIEALERVVQENYHLPWKETLAGVLRLHAPTGARTMTLWDERGVLILDRALPELARVLHRSDQLTDLEALHVLRLGGESSSIVDVGLGILDAARARGPAGRVSVQKGLKWVARFIEMALPVESRLAAATQFADWIDERGLTAFEGADRMLSIRRLAGGLPAETTYKSPTSRNWLATGEEKAERDATVAALLRNSPEDRVENISQRLQVLENNSASDDQVAGYLHAFERSLHREDRISALDVLTSLPSDSGVWRRYSRVFGSTIAAWTTKWNSAASRRWMELEYPRFVRERLPTLVGYDITDLLNAVAGEGCDRDELIIAQIADHLEALGANRLLAFAVHLGSALPMAEHEQTFLWAIEQITDRRTAPPLVGHTSNSQIVPAERDGDEILPALCWQLLGHADRRIRWRAAHLCVDLANADSTFVEKVFSHFDERSSSGYIDDKTEFYWMSAQVWWLAAVRRIARTVKLTSSQIGRLRAVANSRTWPHALLREHARRTLLDLGSDPGHELSLLNQPASCQMKRRNVYGREGHERSKRFNFDSLDVIPYWYERIARIFAIPMTDFLQNAERWIVDDLGFDTESVLSADKAWRKRYDYGDLDKRHGSAPSVDDLSTYLEWHAQFLVAGQLADAGMPMVVGDYEDSTDPWSEWMDGFINPTGGWLIADLRDPTPLEPRFHQPAPAKETWRDRTDEDFDRELFAENGLVVDSNLEVAYGPLFENCWVNSALVSPQSAVALLLACTTTSHNHNWALPEADSYGDNAHDEPGFRLIGWIAGRSRESTGLEKHDQLRRIDLSHAVPDATFGHVDDQTSEQAVWTLKSATAQLIKWSDSPGDWKHDRPRYSEGRRTIVDTRELLTYLKAQELDLLLEVTIKRHYETDRYRPDDDKDLEHYDRGTTRLYILRRDGELVDGVGRHRRLGNGNCFAAVD